MFEEPLSRESFSKKSASREGSIGRLLFVSDCKSLPEAVAHFMDTITPEQLLELDVMNLQIEDARANTETGKPATAGA